MSSKKASADARSPVCVCVRACTQNICMCLSGLQILLSHIPCTLLVLVCRGRTLACLPLWGARFSQLLSLLRNLFISSLGWNSDYGEGDGTVFRGPIGPEMGIDRITTPISFPPITTLCGQDTQNPTPCCHTAFHGIMPTKTEGDCMDQWTEETHKCKDREKHVRWKRIREKRATLFTSGRRAVKLYCGFTTRVFMSAFCSYRNNINTVF